MRKRKFKHRPLTRSQIKKHRNLPSPVMYDPFLQKLIFYNKNGRVVFLDKGMWKEYRVKNK